MTLFDFAMRNIGRDKRSYLYYFMNCTIAVFIFYLFSVLSFHPFMEVIDSESAMGFILGLGEFVSAGFALCFISYSVGCFLKARSRQFGIIRIVGASKKQLNQLIFTENMIVGCASIAVGIMIGTVFSKLFLEVANRVIGVTDFHFYFPVKAIILTVIIFGIVFFLIAYLTPRLIRKERVIQLLKAGKKGEEEPKSAPWVILFLLLSAAVAVSTLVQSPLTKRIQESLLFPFVLLITGILFTYLLFVFSLKLWEWMTKRSGSCYKGTNLIKFSNTAASQRADTQSMTLTAVLYAISLFAMVVLTAMAGNILKETEKITPYAVTYTTWEKTAPKDQQLTFIEEVLSGLSGYQSMRFELYGEGRDKLMPLSVYNQIMEFLGREPVALKEEEMYLVPGNADIMLSAPPISTAELLKESGYSLKLAGSGEKTIMLSGYTSSITVVPDMVLAKMKGSMERDEIYVFQFEGWQQDKETNQRLQEGLKESVGNQEISLITAYNYYESSRLQNNLTLYIGGMLCFAFLIAVSSLVYSRLYSRLKEDCKKYRGIVKLGLSPRELSGILKSRVRLLLLAPFAAALVYQWIGIWMVEKHMLVSNIPSALWFTLLFVTVQGIFYALIASYYKKNVFREVYNG